MKSQMVLWYNPDTGRLGVWMIGDDELGNLGICKHPLIGHNRSRYYVKPLGAW